MEPTGPRPAPPHPPRHPPFQAPLPRHPPPRLLLPEQLHLFGLDRFDGILAFGQALNDLYRQRFHLEHVWDPPRSRRPHRLLPHPHTPRTQDAVWIGNWGEGERSAEIQQFFLDPAAALAPEATFAIYGVRYPEEGLRALAAARVDYRGYLPNLAAPATYAAARLTVHIPRQQYSGSMTGIPTIRVFEALASGIPLISAPWQDTEQLFRPGDFLWAANTAEMTEAIRHLLHHPEAAAAHSARGLETIIARHTCAHRARELTAICQDLLS